MDFISFFLSVLTGIIATVIYMSLQKAYQHAKKYRNSKYSGEWVDEIYEDDLREKIIKRDRFTIKHNKKDNTITGTFGREYPVDQTHKKWMLNGVIDGRYMIFSFWGEEMQKSNGCVYVKLIKDYVYEGYYLEEHETGIDMTPIKISKVRVVKK